METISTPKLKPKLDKKNTEVYDLLVKLNMPKSQIAAFIKKHTKKTLKPAPKKLLPEYKLNFITKCDTCGNEKHEVFFMLNSIKYSLVNNKEQLDLSIYDDLPSRTEYRNIPICKCCESRLNSIPQHEVVKMYLSYIQKTILY